MNIIKQLLPGSNLLKLESYQLESESATVKLFLSSTQVSVKCPVCDFITGKIHSHYERTLADLSWANYQISIKLQAQKFFCINANCQRKIFTERLNNLVLPWARRTTRLASQLTAIALSSGGALGVRLSKKLGLNISRNTLLNLIRRIPLPSFDSPKTIGVDDFCFRKCKTYGTVIVDLDKNRPITLLKDRSSETLSAWLKENSGIEIVSRDRAKAYSKGIREGAPDSIQVADRFHLIQNLSQILYEVFGIYTEDLKEVEKKYVESCLIKDENNVILLTDSTLKKPSNIQKEKAAINRAKKVENYQKVKELRSQGYKVHEIVKELGIGRATVFRYLRNPAFIERRSRSDKGQSFLNSYEDYIIKRWNEGCHETKILFEEIREQGFNGTYNTVNRYTQLLRDCQDLKKHKVCSNESLPKIIKPLKKPLTPHRATWLILCSNNLSIPDSEGQDLIMLLKSQNPDLKEGIELAENFISIVSERKSSELDSWLNQATKSILSPFSRFASGLLSDYNAIKAAVTMPISNGQVEGQVNRLKMLKRQMYGRAKLDLLTRRFLLLSSSFTF